MAAGRGAGGVGFGGAGLGGAGVGGVGFGGAGLGGGGVGGAGGVGCEMGCGGEMNSLISSTGTTTSGSDVRIRPACKAHSPAACNTTTEPAITAFRPERPAASN